VNRFLIDGTVCEHCGGAVKIIACIEDKLTVRKIPAHVESATSPPGQQREPSMQRVTLVT
jgi:hypothetical protein